MDVFYNLQDAHFWVFIALAVVIGIMIWLRVPALVTKALDDAGAKVQTQLDEATRLRQEAQTLLAQIQVQRQDTEIQAGAMLKAAQADAERLRTEAAAQLDEDIRRRRELAERKIAIAEAAAASEVKAAAADLAAQAAEIVLAARIASAKTDPLIDAAFADLGRRFQ